MRIKIITAREILDSRGNPTVEVSVELTNGVRASAGVPSGASTGAHEAVELRDRDRSRYLGRGVLKACRNVTKKIAPKLKGLFVLDQAKIDAAMIKLDGTPNKKKLGANAIVGVSLACARAAALARREPLYAYLRKLAGVKEKILRLPTPLFNVFNGGKHADTNLDFQEFMIIPLRGRRFSDKLRCGTEIFHHLGLILQEEHFDTDKGDEGGYAPAVRSTIEVFKLLLRAIERAGYEPAGEVGLGVDAGASELYDPYIRRYVLQLDNMHLGAHHLIELYAAWRRHFPLILLEDGLAEDDWDSWRMLTQELGKHMLLVGDDLFVTNVARLEEGIRKRAANAALVKPNQVGTLTETLAFVKRARDAGLPLVFSHRSGETNDDFIADLAVGCDGDFIKTGAPNRGERVAKYNRLIAIEDEALS